MGCPFERNFCNYVFLIQTSMEIYFIHLRKSMENMTSLIFSNIFNHCKDLFIMRQTACDVSNQIVVDSYDFTAVVQDSVSITAST